MFHLVLMVMPPLSSQARPPFDAVYSLLLEFLDEREVYPMHLITDPLPEIVLMATLQIGCSTSHTLTLSWQSLLEGRLRDRHFSELEL